MPLFGPPTPVDLTMAIYGRDWGRVSRYLSLLEAAQRFADEGLAARRRQRGEPGPSPTPIADLCREALDRWDHLDVDGAASAYHTARHLTLMGPRSKELSKMLDGFWKDARDTAQTTAYLDYYGSMLEEVRAGRLVPGNDEA
jgi:hypothetical protein